MKQTTKTWMCGAAALVLAAGAQAQTPLPLLAPGFETANPLSPASPNQFNNNGNSEIRRVNRSVVTPHSGDWCVIMEPPTDNGFAGMTTDSRNFFAPGFPFFDVAYDYNGGDILMTAWYMIPANAPVNFDRDPMGLVLGGAPSGIKINIKGAADPNQDNATLDPWGVEGPYAHNLVFGTTNGEWRQISFRFTQADIHNQVEVVNGFILPPNPNRAKITIGRFAYGLPNATGVVYWDDITFEQVPPLGGGCRADFNGDGFVDPDDLSDYIACFFAMPPCDRGDFNGDGFTDPDDLSDYIALFFGGC